MSTPAKKALKQTEMDEENDSDSSSDSDSGSSIEMDTHEDVEIEFEARSAEDCDIDGIKSLLSQLFLQSNIDIGALTDLIISQNYVGSVLTQSEDVFNDDGDDDEDVNEVFGLTTVINLKKKSAEPCIKQLKHLILERSKRSKSDNFKQFQDMIEDQNTELGFLLNERFINIPAKISVPLLESLSKEMKEANEKKQLPFKFDKLMMICKINKLKKAKKNTNPDALLFANAEEEIISEEALYHFDYDVSNERDALLAGNWSSKDDTYSPWRRIIVLEASRLDAIVDKIRSSLT